MTHEELKALLDALPEDHTFVKQVILAVWYRVVDENMISYSDWYWRCPADTNPDWDYDILRCLAGFDPDKLKDNYDLLDREVEELYREVCGDTHEA